MDLGQALAPLATLRRFVNYATYPDPDRPGKTIKRPTDVNTGLWCDSNKPEHQYSYFEASGTGKPIGFVFVEGDGYFFVDIDGALIDTPAGKQWSPLAHEICNTFLGAAIEVSQSGTGLHIIGRGKAPPHACKNIGLHIELYTDSRFCALTGTGLKGDASLDFTAALTTFAERYFPPNPHGEIAGWSSEPVEGYGGPADDADLLRAALASGKKSAANVFGGNVTFADLWDANEDALAKKWPGDKGSYDASQADGSLAGHLAYWTGKNHERTRELMLRSGLVRQKWDDRPEWLEMTIMKAASVVQNVAKGRAPIPPPATVVTAGDGNSGLLVGVTFDGDGLPAQQPELVKGLLPIEGIAFLGGQSGAGKTFIAIDLAVALAANSANEFFGRSIKERVGVAIFAAEGYGTLSDRLRVAKERRGIVGPVPIAYFALDFDLSAEQDTAKLCEVLQEIAARFQAEFGVRLGLVIVDTVAAAVGMENENDNAEASRTIRSLRSIGAATGALIMPVHHYGKAEDTGLRGASGFRAGADVVLSVLADRNQKTGEVTNRRLALSKSRTREEGPISGFDLVPVNIGIDEDGEIFGSCAVAPNGIIVSPTRGHSEPQSHRDYRAAVDAAIDAHGEVHSEASGQPAGPAVQLRYVRDEFYQRRATPHSDKRKQSEAARKAFGNARDALGVHFPTWKDDHGVEWLRRVG